jgi:hypothetical protein
MFALREYRKGDAMAGEIDNDGFNLFDDVLADVDVAHLPLGGVHPEVIRATAKEGGGFTKSNVARWGIPTIKDNKGWTSRLSAGATLEEIEHREQLAPAETIVSRKVRGSWRTGALDLDRDDVVAILERQGYEQSSDADLPTQRVERWRRGPV